MVRWVVVVLFHPKLSKGRKKQKEGGEEEEPEEPQGGRWCCPENLSRGLTGWLLHSLGEAYVKIGWKPISMLIQPGVPRVGIEVGEGKNCHLKSAAWFSARDLLQPRQIMSKVTRVIKTVLYGGV